MSKKMVIVRQQDVKDCGPCALSSIIQYYGGYVPLEKIRDDAFTSLKGTTVYHLVQAGKKYGFDVEAKKIQIDQIDKLILPAIVHILYENGQTHYMCLYKVLNDSVIVMDPAEGKKEILKADFVKIFTGVVIEFVYCKSLLSLKKETSIYSLFGQIILKYRSLCISLLICSLLLTISTICLGLYFKVFYEFLLKGSFQKIIIYFFIAILLLKLSSDYFKNYYENYLNKNVDVELFRNFLKHVFSIPLKVINKRSSGEIISRINDLFSIKELFSEVFVTTFLDFILAITSLICLYSINSKLSLIIIFFIAIYIIVALLFNPYISKRINQNIILQTKINASLLENINMINSIKNLNKTSYVLNSIEEKVCDFIFDNFTFTNIINRFNLIKNIIIESGIFVANTYGLYLCYRNSLSIFDLFIFNSLMIYFVDPIKSAVSLIPKFTYLKVSFSKISDFIAIEEENIGALETFENGDIEIKNVSFSYDGYHKTFNNLNLKIKKGEKVIVKGQSGTGKSTLCQLLQGTYKPDNGFIMINHKNILDYSLCTLKTKITYVSQNEYLYSDTIKNNILINQNSNSLFSKVCNICLIESIVSKRPFRYNFGIDNSIQNISGGEKQRIILARALMNCGDILVLDEALSELDYHLERKIINNIKKYFPEKTLIYISHKNQDNLFDRVINLERTENEQ